MWPFLCSVPGTDASPFLAATEGVFIQLGTTDHFAHEDHISHTSETRSGNVHTEVHGGLSRRTLTRAAARSANRGHLADTLAERPPDP